MATTNLTLEKFESTISSDGIVLIDFWAAWCGPCQRFGPTFEAVSEKHPDIVFAKVDTEAEQELAARMRIQSIPTLMLFRDGVPLLNNPGVLSAEVLDDLISQARGLDMVKVRAEYEQMLAEQGSA
ncbi:MAG: thioredoxin [Ilumatobacteraceae bacterium]